MEQEERRTTRLELAPGDEGLVMKITTACPAHVCPDAIWTFHLTVLEAAHLYDLLGGLLPPREAA
jgi:hypothetical protein